MCLYSDHADVGDSSGSSSCPGSSRHSTNLKFTFAADITNSSAVALADFFLDSTDAQAVAREIDRFLDLLFGRPVITPTPDELGMAHAYVSAMRSSEMGRQVGAAITDAEGNLLACGTNEVPKAHGGYYWDGADYDKRDWRLGEDSSDKFKRNSLGELLQVLSDEDLLSTRT